MIMKHFQSISHTLQTMACMALIVCGATACSNDDDTLDVPTGTTDIPIRLSVASVEGMKNTRALIESETDLQTSCKPTANGGEGETIGVWGDCIIGSGNEQITQKDIFKGTYLAYDASIGSNPHSDWNYEGGDRYWSKGGFYKFRAYYPSNSVDVMSQSSASTFVVNYNTALQQYDLLVAYNEVDAGAPDVDLTQPVPLKMRHALSALKFKFEFEEGYADSDKLTACWLENTASGTNGFYNLGLLIYGNEASAEDITWTPSYRPIIGEKMYLWKSSGLPIVSNTTATTQSPTAYTTPSGYTTTEGAAYTGNDGFLLILPQTSKGKTDLCFTTEGGGNTPYTIGIPAVTGTSLQTWMTSGFTDATNASGTDFVPGYRYTYTVVITKTDLYMTLSIAPWDKYDSSFSITL